MYKNLRVIIVLVSLTLLNNVNSSPEGEFCDRDTQECTQKSRYLFYDVNPPEGFNLRRDVFMRYAILARKLWKSSDPELENFKLVLPPWSMLYHWRSKDEPEHLPWGLFFNVESMKAFAPVIEMHEFFQEIGIKYTDVKIDEVYVLQHYKDMFSSGKFVEKMSIEKCNEEIATNFFYYDNVTSSNIKCLSFHGFAGRLAEVLKNTTAQTILFDHSEVALHDRFGDKIYWKCRRSMRFSKDLKQIADDFREQFLNSTDDSDATVLPHNWQLEKPGRNAIGGPYLGVHLRRRDFVYGRPQEVPSLKNAASQIRKIANGLALTMVYIATDAPNKEFEDLKLLLSPDINVSKFKPNKEIKKKYGEGGTAIIDQIICSHARYFIGTHESTFSFRIQEEREIMGFPVETTFNRFCGNKEKNCGRTSLWKIEY